MTLTPIHLTCVIVLLCQYRDFVVLVYTRHSTLLHMPSLCATCCDGTKNRKRKIWSFSARCLSCAPFGRCTPSPTWYETPVKRTLLAFCRFSSGARQGDRHYVSRISGLETVTLTVVERTSHPVEMSSGSGGARCKVVHSQITIGIAGRPSCVVLHLDASTAIGR